MTIVERTDDPEQATPTKATAPETVLVTWDDVQRELDHWTRAGQSVRLWWRDDDASELNPQLARLTDLSTELQVPLTLCVVVGRATPELVEHVRDRPLLRVAVHGLLHESHETGGRKSEFGPSRPVADTSAELALALAQAGELFGSSALPVFVPPWNRIAARHGARLASLGYQAISSHNWRGWYLGGSLKRFNTHLDPIDWEGGRSVVPAAAFLDDLVWQLRRRRTLRRWSEPVGLLTHHLFHDDAIWAFCRRFLESTVSHAAVEATSLEDLLRGGSGAS